jgi:two-component system, OmpR family, KDP operon response regulator KdpE
MEENKLRLLVVDDERPIRKFLSASLSGAYTVIEAASASEALAAAVTGRPDAILLDLGLPDMDGLDLTRQLREWSHIPIIVISVRDHEEDKVTALDAGADDYLTKPFGIGELMARLRVALRRVSTPESEPVYRTDHLLVDLTRREVTVAGRLASLTPTEYDILRVLIQNAGKVLTHKQLTHFVWGEGFEADPHLLRVNISNLRRKIEPDPARPRFVMTEPGVGYRLKTIEAASHSSG